METIYEIVPGKIQFAIGKDFRVCAAGLIIAIGGDYGNLTEIAIALKMRKPVIVLDTREIPGITKTATPRGVLEIANDLLKQSDN